MTALRALQDGAIWHGQAFGAAATVVGEVVFNTNLTGYQKVVTDPSYLLFERFARMVRAHAAGSLLNEGHLA